MKKISIRLISILLAVAVFLPMTTVLASETQSGGQNNGNAGSNEFIESISGFDSSTYTDNGTEFALLDNNYLSLYVSRKTGGFTVLPSTYTFDAAKGQSYAVFEIDGYFYKFGYGRYTESGTYGNAADVSNVTVAANNEGNPVVVTQWTCAGYTFYQKQTVVKETSMKNSYAVYTEYSLLKGDSVVSVTPYLTLDASFGEGPNDSDISRFMFTKVGVYTIEERALACVMDNVGDGDPLTDDPLLQDFDLISARRAPYNDYFPLVYEDVTVPTKIVMDHYSVEKFDEATQKWVLDTANSRYYDDDFNLGESSSPSSFMKDGLMQAFYPTTVVSKRAATDPIGEATPLYAFVYGYSLLPDARFGRESCYAPEVIYDTPADANKIELVDYGYLPWYGNFTFGYEWETSTEAGKKTGISSVYSQYYLKKDDGDMAEITTALGIAPLTEDGYVTTETFAFGVQTKQISHLIFGSYGNPDESTEKPWTDDSRFIHKHMYMPNAYEQAVDSLYNQDRYKIHVTTAELFEITVVSDDAGRTLVPIAFSSCSCTESQKASGNHTDGHIYEIPSETLLDGKYYAPVGSTVYFAYMQSDDVSEGNGVGSVTATTAASENVTVATNYHYSDSTVNKEQYFSFTMPDGDVTLNVDFSGTADKMAYRVINNSSMITCDSGTATEGERVNLLVDYNDLYAALEITDPTSYDSMNDILDARKKDFIIKVSTISGKNVAIYSNEIKHGFGISSPLHVFGGGGYTYQFGGRTKLVTKFTMPNEGVILSIQVFDRREYSITAIGNNLVSVKVTQAGNKAVKAETDDVLALTIKRQVDSSGRKIDWHDFADAKILINGTELVAMSKWIYQQSDEIQYNFRMPAANSVITVELKQDLKYLSYSNISFEVMNEDGILFESSIAPLEIMNPPLEEKVPEGYVMDCSIRCSPYQSSEFKGVAYNGVYKTVAELVSNGQQDTPIYPCLIDTGYECNGYPVYKYYFMTEADDNGNTIIRAIGNFKAPLEITMAFPDASFYTEITGFHVTGDFIPDGTADVMAYLRDNYTFALEEIYQEYDSSFQKLFSLRRKYGMSASGTGYIEIESATNNGVDDDIFIKLKNYSAATVSDPEFRTIEGTVRYIVTMTDINSSQVRSDTTSFSTTTNPSFAQSSTGALAIVQDYRVKDPLNGGFFQTVVTAPSAEELCKYLDSAKRSQKVIFTVVGEFERVIVGSRPAYIFKSGQTLTINDTVSSYVPEEEGAYFRIDKYSSGLGYTWEVDAKGCDLSVGSFTFFKPKMLESGYAGYRVVVSDDTDYRKEEAEIKYHSYQNDVTLGVNVPGFVAELSGVKIKGDHIEFSGKLAVLEPFTLAEINLEKLEFAYHDGDVSLLGLVANGFAGVENIPLPFEIGGNAYAGIDTYKGEFYFDISINLYFFETEARLYMKPLNSGLIFPDEIYFEVEAEPGITIVPLTPVISLNGGGGGVKDIVTSFNGSFDGIPPIMIEFFGSATIIELIGGKVGARIGLGSLFLYGEELTLLEQEIVDYLELGIELKYGNHVIGGEEYCGFSLNGSGAIRLEVTPDLPILVVSGNITLGVTVGRNVKDATDSILSLGFHGSLKGQLQIPEFGGIGPFNIISGEVFLSLDANAHFNTETSDIQGLFKRVSGNGKIGVVVEVAFWSIKIEYTFGADAPEISSGFFRRSVVPQIKYTENLYDDEGNYKGTFKSGENIEFISQSQDTSPAPMYRSVAYSLMSSPEITEPTVPTVTTGTAISDRHTISMPTLAEAEARNYGYILTEQAANTESPFDFIDSLTVTKPDNGNYPINSLPYAETYTQEQLADKSYNLMYTVDSEGIRTWYLSLTGEGGTWTIDTAEECKLTVLKFNPLPELESVERTGNVITYTTANIDPDFASGYEVRAYLGKDESGELGTVVGKGTISDGSSSLTISVEDETLSSGEYFVKLGLYELGSESMDINGKTIPAVDELIDILMLKGKYVHENVNAPKDVTNVYINYIGNGMLGVSFMKPNEAKVSANQKIKGYAVKLYEKNGGDGSWESPYTYSDTDYYYSLIADETIGTKTIEFSPAGVATGKEYFVSVTPYSQITYMVDDTPTTLNIYGTETISGSYVENRIPELITIDISAENGYVKSATQSSAEFVIGAQTDKIAITTNATPTVSCLKTIYDADNKPTSTYEPVACTSDSDGKYYIDIADIKTALGLAETAELTGFALSIKSEKSFPKDSATFYCNVTIDKTPPKLTADSSTVTVNGNVYSIKGKTETGITVADNYGNKAVSDAETGSFVIRGTLTEAQLEAITNETKIGVFTADKSGNSGIIQLSVTKRELKVGDIDILAAENFSDGVFTYSYTENGNSGTVVFNPESETLKLSSLNLVSWTDFGIYTNSDITLELDGTCTIAFCNATVDAVVNVGGTLTVTGTGTLASRAGAPINNTFIATGKKLVINSGTIFVDNPSETTGSKPIISVTDEFYQYKGEIKLQNSLGSYYAISTGSTKLFGGDINISGAYGGLLAKGELTILGGELNISTTNLPAVVAYKSNSAALTETPMYIDIESISEIMSGNSMTTAYNSAHTYITTFKDAAPVILSSDDLTGIEGASKNVVIETVAHAWDEGVATTPATHTAEGVMTYTCLDCDETRTEPIAKTTAHEYGDWTACEDGTNHIRTCVCGEASETAAHTWNSGAVTKVATHTEAGVTTYTCTACSATKTEPIAKITEHSYGNWVNHSETQHKKICVCGDTVYADHTWNAGTVTKAATHTEAGVTTYTCTACSATKTEPISKTTEHEYGDWMPSNDGLNHECSCACGETQKEAHGFGDITVTAQPTETADGAGTHTCEVCKFNGNVTIPKLSTENGYTRTVVKEATEAEEGQVEWNHADYGKFLTSIPKLEPKPTQLDELIKEGKGSFTDGKITTSQKLNLADIFSGNVKAFRGANEVTGYIATGDIVNLYDEGGNIIDTATAIVKGDVFADGNVTIIDAIQVRLHLLGTALNDAQYLAADASGDTRVNILDFIQIRLYLLGLAEIK